MVNFVITNVITTKLYTKNDDNNVDSNNGIVSNDGMDTKPRNQKDLKATQYVLLLSSIYYHIQLYPRQIDHNQMNHSWNKNFTEVGYCVVVGGGKVDINSVHQKQQQQQPSPIPSSMMYQ